MYIYYTFTFKGYDSNFEVFFFQIKKVLQMKQLHFIKLYVLG